MKSDHPFADLDRDGRPELAVGRLPADTPEEVAHMTASIFDYEVVRAPGLWQVEATLAEGDPGWGEFQGSVIDWFASLETKLSTPPELALTRLSANTASAIEDRSSVYTLSGREQAHALHYIGHGGTNSVDVASDKVSATPIVSLAACLSANRLAPAALREGKTVAVVASTEIAGPHVGPALTRAFVDELGNEKAKTVGEVYQRTKERITERRVGFLSSILLWLGDLVVRIMRYFKLTDADVGEDKHVIMYNLIGDPGVRLRRPLAIRDLTIEPRDDGTVTIVAEMPRDIPDGKAVFVLERTIGTVPLEPIDAKLSPDEQQARKLRNAKRYNDRVAAKMIVDFTGGEARATMKLPADAKPGDYTLRAVGIGESEVAVAARADLTVASGQLRTK